LSSSGIAFSLSIRIGRFSEDKVYKSFAGRGVSEDIPVPANYDGDGKIDVAVWRPSTGNWFVLSSAAPGTYRMITWGNSTDKPVAGDYDGDGKMDIAVWRPSTGVWYMLPSSNAGSYISATWGQSTDIPVTGLTSLLRALP
jgi:hypothetical protein